MSYNNRRHNGHYAIFCEHRRDKDGRSLIRVLWCRGGQPQMVLSSRMRTVDDADGALKAIEIALKAGPEFADACHDCHELDIHPTEGPALDLRDARIYIHDLTVERGINEHFKRWARRGWKTVNGTPVCHAEVYQRIHEQMNVLGARVVYADHHETWPEYQDLIRHARKPSVLVDPRTPSAPRHEQDSAPSPALTQ